MSALHAHHNGENSQQPVEMIAPYGFTQLVDPSDRNARHFKNAIMDITEIAGENGLRHIEIRVPSATHYHILALGFMVPLSLDDMLKLLFDESGARKANIEDLFINPAVPTRQLCKEWEANVRDPPSMPALVALVPSSAFLQRVSVKRVDHGTPLDLNGYADAVAELFPDMVDRRTGTINTALLYSNSNGGGGGGGGTTNKVLSLDTIYAAGPGDVSRIECMIRDGSMSPRQRPLPQFSVPLLSDDLIKTIDPKTWKSPVPRSPVTDQEFTEFVRLQLDAVFKYLYMIHVRPGRNHSIKDHPIELRISRHSPFSPHAPVYVCQAMGYSSNITLTDMLRLYLCDPTHVKDIYFDFDCRPQDTSLSLGALTMVFQVELNPSRATIARSINGLGLMDDSNSAPAPVKLKRLSVQTPPEPMAGVEAPAEQKPPSAFKIHPATAGKRKAERLPVEPAPQTPVEAEPPAPHPVDAIIQEEQQAAKRSRSDQAEVQAAAAQSSSPSSPPLPSPVPEKRITGLSFLSRLFGRK